MWGLPDDVYKVYIVHMNVETTMPVGVAQARKALGRLVTNAALLHQPSLITNGEAVGLLLGADDVESLAAGLTFNPDVYQDGEGVSAWLPELELYGHGDDVEAALEDLADEIREYLAEYLGDIDRYRHAPNRSSHFPYLLKALALDAVGHLDRLLRGSEAAVR
jgi:antitoxin YefM